LSKAIDNTPLYEERAPPIERERERERERESRACAAEEGMELRLKP